MSRRLLALALLVLVIGACASDGSPTTLSAPSTRPSRRVEQINTTRPPAFEVEH